MPQYYGKNVIYPEYEYNEMLKVELEKQGPPAERYMALGYDENPGDRKKHYRMFYKDELENVKSIMPDKPFHERTIRFGASGVPKALQ